MNHKNVVVCCVIIHSLLHSPWSLGAGLCQQNNKDNNLITHSTIDRELVLESLSTVRGRLKGSYNLNENTKSKFSYGFLDYINAYS